MQSKFSTQQNQHIAYAVVTLTNDEYALATGQVSPNKLVSFRVKVDLRRLGQGYAACIQNSGETEVLGGGIRIERLKEVEAEHRDPSTPNINAVLKDQSP